MKKTLICFAICIYSFLSFAQEDCFKPGEELFYNFRYGFINAGKGSLKLKTKSYKNINYLFAEAIGKTTGIFSLYKVKDVYGSYIDTKTDLPVACIRDIKEGSYVRYDVGTFHRDSSMVYSSQKKKFIKVKDNALDIVSVYYFIRKHCIHNNMQKNDTISMNTYFDCEPFDIKIIYKGNEIIKSKFGKIKCYKFIPLVKKGKLFTSKDNIELYISADNNKIPIKARFKIFIGAFVCELDGFRGLSHSFRIIK
ncbi:DUF3108 domain-containing protein [Marinilabiliaceae bacterium JC040]|nr:DUF3108 domain-containing protein [Marinilabiliaceae bacterium JC040]